jgi:subtilisin family serine protease
VRVAVIDTGIDTRHPDLAGKVDGGYNAITDSEAPDSYIDDNGHGTHVSGTIAAIRGGKVVGVAPKARLYAVKVLDADGSGNLSDVIKGIIWCANNGIQVANMSLGSPEPSDTMEQALRYAEARNVIVVAAAGNSGGAVGYPGAYPETIAVSASDWNDQIAYFSSRGPEVKFIAPGVNVVSTFMGGDYLSLSGTSMATPHVTGLAALAVSQGYRGLEGPDGVLAALKRAAKPLPGLDPVMQGFGMIDAGLLTRSSDMAAAR